MPFVKCQLCGNDFQVDDNDDATAVVCPNCHSDGAASEEAGTDSCLIFAIAAGNVPITVTTDELQEKLESGVVTPYDLIFQDGNWVPLGHVYELPAPTLAEDHKDQPEVAVALKELQPIAGYPKLPRCRFSPRTQRVINVIKWLVAAAVCLYGIGRAIVAYKNLNP